MTAEEVQPTWEMLVDLERKLQRNVRMSRILQPVGLAIFALNFSIVPRKWRGWSFMEAMGEYQQ